ncbi:MAG TPA: phosphatase PAP2 family protein [Chromatiales bacterium]|nr:phosphatase PAP2 family protein [Chromatiales bacterium]
MIRILPLKSPWTWAIPLTGLALLLAIGLTGSNQRLFLYLNDLLYLEPAGVWLNITLFGDAGMILVLMLPFVGRRPDLIWSAVLAALLTTLLVNGGKEFFLADRPPSVLAAGSFHQMGNLFGATSFPSGHTAAAFTLAGVLAQLPFSNRVRVGVLLYAFLIGLSRIAIGAHWPMDVAAGMAVGWFGALLGVRLARRIPGEGVWVQRVAALLLVTTVYYLVVVHQSGDKEARMLEIIVPLACLGLALPGLARLFRPGTARA